MRRGVAVLLLTMVVLLAACATTKKEARPWQPGDTIICPHCGRAFPVPEKLGQ
jgi:uncharacterized protein YbaR (Trm112 family)